MCDHAHAGRASIVAAIAQLTRNKSRSPERIIGPGDADMSFLAVKLESVRLQREKLLQEVARLKHLEETLVQAATRPLNERFFLTSSDPNLPNDDEGQNPAYPATGAPSA